MNSSPLRVVVVGGSDAGVSAALRAKEVDPSAVVTVLLGDDFPNYSVCGLPFHLSGEIGDWRMLAHRTSAQLQATGIAVLTRHQVTSIDASRREVEVIVDGDPKTTLGYDRLIIATGAHAKTPVGAPDTPGVFCLRTMDDCFSIDRYIRDRAPATALIVGGGYIGVEMADALTRRGMAVTLCGRGLLSTVDPSFGEIVGEHLGRNGVHVIGASVDGVAEQGSGFTVALSNGHFEQADLVLFAAGVEPTTELARLAGVTLGETGAIAVSRAMETNLPNVYAAGDCTETWHRLLERPVYQPLGTIAHKQGRVAGENVVGGNSVYAGTLGTQVVKVFDLAIARTGLSDRDAQAEGLTPLTVEAQVLDRTAYYPGGHSLRVRLTGDIRTGRLLGAQVLGDWRAQVAKRLDILATAIHQGMSVADLDALDLSYTPPLSTPWDPVQAAGQVWMSALRERA